MESVTDAAVRVTGEERLDAPSDAPRVYLRESVPALRSQACAKRDLKHGPLE